MNMKEIATVRDLIEHLQKNFKPDDLLCFFDEGGAWIELEHVPKNFIGDKRWMFNYVKDKRQHELDNPCCAKEDEECMKKIIVDNYKSVEDNGVVIF